MNTSLSKTSKTIHILIVDDEPMMRNLLKSAFEKKGYSCVSAENGKKALDELAIHPFDVVVTDIDMPVMDGLELAKIIQSNFTTDVIVMTGQIQSYQYEEIVGFGVSDFVQKPFSPREMILRTDRVLNERRLRQLAQEAHENLKESYVDSIHRLVMAAEYRDEDTGDHIIRIGEYSPFIAEKLNLPKEFIDTIRYASPMHDIGKIGIPDNILLKPGRLTDIEFETIKTHTTIGAKLLSHSKSKIIQMAEEIALTHHEKFNGKGYPNQLKGTDIPISGRIIAIADTFDAITSKRPYKEPYPFEMALELLKKERGKHFDPDVLDVFVENFDKIVEIRGRIGTFEGETFQGFILSERDRVDKT